MRRTLSIHACAVIALGLSLAAPLFAHHVKKGESTTLPVTTASPPRLASFTAREWRTTRISTSSAATTIGALP